MRGITRMIHLVHKDEITGMSAVQKLEYIQKLIRMYLPTRQFDLLTSPIEFCRSVGEIGLILLGAKGLYHVTNTLLEEDHLSPEVIDMIRKYAENLKISKEKKTSPRSRKLLKSSYAYLISKLITISRDDHFQMCCDSIIQQTIR